jgi:hypothetical protein
MGTAACLIAAGMARNGIAHGHEPTLIQPPPVVAVDLAGPALGLAPGPTATPKHRAPRPVILAQATPSPAPLQEQKQSVSWLEDMQAAGYKDLDVDHLIQLKIHGVTGEYIRRLLAAGYNLTGDELVAFRIHGVTNDFINALKQAGLRNVRPEHLIALRIHGVTADAIRQIQELGYPNLSVDEAIAFGINGITPDFIRTAQSHGFKNLKPDQLVRLRQMGIPTAREII